MSVCQILIAGAQGGPWMVVGVWADMVSPNFPVKKLKCQDTCMRSAALWKSSWHWKLDLLPPDHVPWARVT